MYAWDCLGTFLGRRRWSIIYIIFIAGQNLSWFSEYLTNFRRLGLYHRPIRRCVYHMGEQRICLSCKRLGNREVILVLRDRHIPFAPHRQTNEPILNVIGRISQADFICQISKQLNDYYYYKTITSRHSWTAKIADWLWANRNAFTKNCGGHSKA